jgi:hypothetical protein
LVSAQAIHERVEVEEGEISLGALLDGVLRCPKRVVAKCVQIVNRGFTDRCSQQLSDRCFDRSIRACVWSEPFELVIMAEDVDVRRPNRRVSLQPTVVCIEDYFQQAVVVANTGHCEPMKLVDNFTVEARLSADVEARR